MRIAAAVALVALLGCGGPIPVQPPKSSAGDPFTALRSVPLKLPQLAAGQDCSKTEARDLDAHLQVAFGEGPVYLFGGPSLPDYLHGNVGHPSKVAWGAAPAYNGPIRIRGGRIDAAGQILFESFDNRWRGPPVKKVDGSDLVPELDFMESHSTFPNVPLGWRMWPSGTYVPAPGCYAFQVDGTGFSEMITIQA